MRVPVSLLMVLLVCGPAAEGHADKPPPNEPPQQLWRASASEKGGKVLLQIAQPEYIEPRQADAAEAMRWRDLKVAELGEAVHAFGVDGKRMDAKAVLKGLAKPKGVAVLRALHLAQPLLDPPTTRST